MKPCPTVSGNFPARRRGQDEQGDRSAARHQPEHGRDPPRQNHPETRSAQRHRNRALRRQTGRHPVAGTFHSGTRRPNPSRLDRLRILSRRDTRKRIYRLLSARPTRDADAYAFPVVRFRSVPFVRSRLVSASIDRIYCEGSRLMTRLVALTLVVECLILFPSRAHAQATLAGVVRDSSDAVLPGVTVEASSPALIQKVRTAVTDGRGQYRITELPPGVYDADLRLSRGSARFSAEASRSPVPASSRQRRDARGRRFRRRSPSPARRRSSTRRATAGSRC